MAISSLHALVTVKPGFTLIVAFADTARDNSPALTAAFTIAFTFISFSCLIGLHVMSGPTTE
jgi:hypothetical protein